MLADLPKRIECFDISHIQGAETVASMVVWEDGKMKKSDYRKFIIRTVEGRRLRLHARSRNPPLQAPAGRKKADAEPGADRWRPRPVACRGRGSGALEIINQPLAAIAKREEIIYVYGQEKDPIALDHHSPVLTWSR